MGNYSKYKIIRSDGLRIILCNGFILSGSSVTCNMTCKMQVLKSRSVAD